MKSKTRTKQSPRKGKHQSLICKGHIYKCNTTFEKKNVGIIYHKDRLSVFHSFWLLGIKNYSTGQALKN